MYFGGRLLAPLDRLGSVRMGPNGPVAYFPWGEERTTTPDGTDKFATYFRDVTNNGVGEDYANARYYNNNFGRFWSPDPAGVNAHPNDPQSWNRYAYANDDPVNMFDPSGLGSGFAGADPNDPTSGGPGRTNGGCTTFADEGGWWTGGWTISGCWYTGIDFGTPIRRVILAAIRLGITFCRMAGAVGRAAVRGRQARRSRHRPAATSS